METLSRANPIIEKVEGGLRIDSKILGDQIEPLVEYFSKNHSIRKERVLGGKKRIALVIPYHPLYETGGLEIGTRKIALGLKQLGDEVEIISRGKYENRDLTGTTISPEGIQIQGIGSGIEEIIPYIFNRRHDFDVVQWMEIFPPIPEEENIYNDKAEQQYLASVVLRALGIRTFLYIATSGNVTNRGVNNPKWEHHPNQQLGRLLRAGIEGFDMINSDISSEYEKAGVNIASKEMVVIPLGVDTDKFQPVNDEEKLKLRKLLKLPENKVIFICPGRFVKRKKQDLLFSVWEELPENVKKSATLLFVGGKAGQGQPDSIYEYLMDQINKYLAKRNKDVLTADLVSHEEMTRYIQASDAMIFPSEREGLGMVILESIACGKPVFATNIVGVRDIIKNENTGTLFEPNDKKQIENYINSFITSPGKYKQKSVNARAYVANNWSWESICKKLDKFYGRF